MKKSLLFCLCLLASINSWGQYFRSEELMKVGVYYYPEQCPEEQWERDIKNIASLGFEFIHMAEFAWAQMEPLEGQYDFDWLDRVVGLAEKYELKVVLGTPTPCPPKWMTDKYPEVYLQDSHYQRKEHGTRANISVTNPKAIALTEGMVTAMAKHYANRSSIVAWQIDNEPEGKKDYSPSAQVAFQKWLKAKYKTISGLNYAWGTAFWSQHYDSFEAVNIHNQSQVGWWGTNPIALLDFDRFTADQQAKFLDLQARIIRKYVAPEQQITTNYVAKSYGADPSRTHDLDFPSFTAYPNYGSANLGEQGFRIGDPNVLLHANDYFRSQAGLTGVMELQPGQVNWAGVNSLLLPGTVKMWLWHCFAGGSAYACTYRYRQVLYGSEQYHAGIVLPDGETLSMGGKEYVEFMDELKQLKKVANPTSNLPKSWAKRKTAVLWSYDNFWNLNTQGQTQKWNSWEILHRFHSLLNRMGNPVTFIHEEEDFNQYPFMVVPAYEMVDQALVDKWKKYVEHGGQLFLTARTGAKDKNNHLWEDDFSGIMSSLIGAKIEAFDMLPFGKVGKIDFGNQSLSWDIWADLLEVEEAEVIGSYADQFYEGKAAMVKNKLGKGAVWYLGAYASDGALEAACLEHFLASNGLDVKPLPEGVFSYWHQGVQVWVNYSSNAYTLAIDKEQKVLFGQNPIPPAGILVCQ
ncbi:beta-galactosidase [Persicobacter diffluens]|uniref:Beta-galactosidase n=1 Tax=Persicobacter diffluens TaxID=981 RepID=A0AAN4W3X6_9BACT|nr:hypothetical protein PEDI_47400 [Persicobacter diffluens]